MEWSQDVGTGFTAGETVEEYTLGSSPRIFHLQMSIWTLGEK